MAKYQGTSTNGITNFVDAATEESASDLLDNLVSGNNVIKNVGICYQSDFTLIDQNFERQYQIITMEGWTFYGTALNRKAYITKWKTARALNTGNFVNQTYLDCDEAPKAKFNFNKQKEIRGLGAHFGQTGHLDYTPAKIPTVIAKAVAGQYTHITDDYSTNGVAMQPANGNLATSTIGQAIVAAEAAGLDYILRLSITGATGGGPVSAPTPRLPATILPSWNAAIPTSESWTKAEIDGVYSDYFTRGVNVQTLHPNRRYWCIGSEVDNLNTQLKLKSGSGSSPLAEPVFNDVKQTYVFSSSNNNGTIIYDARWLPVAIAAVAGFDNGLKSVRSDAITMMNGSSTHYGLFLTLFKEVKRYGAYINWYLTDWYSTEETGTDTSKKFSTANIAMRGRAIENAYVLFVKSKLCDGVGAMEMGYKDNFSNLGMTEIEYYDKVIRQCYWADPRTVMISDYEALDEPLARAGSTAFEQTLGQSAALTTAMAGWQYYPKPPLVNPFI